MNVARVALTTVVITALGAVVIGWLGAVLVGFSVLLGVVDVLTRAAG